MLNAELHIQNTLNQRNHTLASFWFSDPLTRSQIEAELFGKKALMVDADDAFTEMLAQQLSAIGLMVEIVKFNDLMGPFGSWDLFVMGPGPGDPRNLEDHRIAKMHHIMKYLILEKKPFFAVCLSHQILCLQLGLCIERILTPKQGMQSEISFYGTPERVGFYNTYAASCDAIQMQDLENRHIEVCRDVNTNEVHAVRGYYFASVQFHPESILTRNGINIIARSVKGVMR